MLIKKGPLMIGKHGSGHLICVVMCNIDRDMVKNRFFNNGGTNLHIELSQTMGSCQNVFIMVADPHNMGYTPFFVSYLQY